MRDVITGSRARRGLIVALDGLAIWLLAVVLATDISARTVERTGGGTLATAVDVTTAWWTTPGVDGLELLAYAGLAVAVLGPTWVWFDRSRSGSTGDRRPGADGGVDGPFEFGQEPAADGRSTAVSIEERSPGVYDVSIGDGGWTQRLGWASELFDDEPLEPPPARAEFFRSSGRSRRSTTDAVEAGPDDGRVGAIAPRTGDTDAAATDAASDQSAQPADGDGTSADAVERAVADIQGSRSRIEAVSSRLASAGSVERIEPASETLVGIAGEPSTSLEQQLPLRTDGECPLAAAIAGTRDEQRRIEAAFDVA